MTLDEAIKHCEDVAEDRCGCAEDCVEEHRQLAEWLKELRERRAKDKTNNCEYEDIFEYCPRCGMRILVSKPKDEPQTETKTETQNSNKNSNVISVYDGVSEAVRCAMCSNPNKSDRGCDGACSYDEILYERIIDAIDESRVDTPQTDCLTCRYNSDEWDSPKCDGCSKAHSNYEPQTDCAWK